MRDYSQVGHIRKMLEERLHLGASIDAFIDKIFAQAPNTLIELIFDDEPIQDDIFWQKVIHSLDALEHHVDAEKLYLHLARQPYNMGVELLHLAMNKHWGKLWLIELSRIVEGDMMGYHHTMRKRRDRDFLVWCFRYAWNGAREGLIQMAAETGDPIPASALLCVEAKEEAITAAVKALEYNSNSQVLEYIVAAKGPDIQEILGAILARMSTAPESASIQSIKECYSDLF